MDVDWTGEGEGEGSTVEKGGYAAEGLLVWWGCRGENVGLEVFWTWVGGG